jgi:hypothetical protein
MLHSRCRLNEGGDTGLDTSFVNKVSLHSWDGQNNYTPDFTYLLGVVSTGGNLTHAASGLAFRLRSTSPTAGTATVAVCRRSSTGQETNATCTTPGYDGDCDGLSGAADPDCASFLGLSSGTKCAPAPSWLLHPALPAVGSRRRTSGGTETVSAQIGSCLNAPRA